MDHKAPKTYKQFHNVRRNKPQDTIIQDIEYSAQIIQKGWMIFKRKKILNKI